MPRNKNHLDVPLEVGIKGFDQWVMSPQYSPSRSRWNNPLILTIDPNFQLDIQASSNGQLFLSWCG